MTEEEKKKMLAAFVPPKPDTEPEEDYWTDERIIEAAKKIKERIGLDETFQQGDGDRSLHGNR